MREVIEHIDRKTEKLRLNPFITWLKEPTPERDRLSAWLPAAAFFVFGFKDLNAEIFRYPEGEAAADPLKKAVNDHASEDSNHWQWYLSDLHKLGLDRPMKFSEALRYLWSEETRTQRMATYQFCVLASRATDPLIRYSMLTALESFAHILFGTLVEISRVFESEIGTKLSYLGQIHFEREPGHMVNQSSDTESLLLNTVLDDQCQAFALEMVDAVWDLIDARWREFHRNVTALQASTVGAA